jgi:hypothetical protein
MVPVNTSRQPDGSQTGPGDAEAAAAPLTNRRGHRRFPAWLDVALTEPGRRTSAPATVVDLSLGGALIQTHQAVAPGSAATISLTSRHGPAVLAGTIIRDEATWTGHLLHMEFASPDAASRLALCKLLDELEHDFRRHQVGIAVRHR